ncbi:MAG TPA: ABC transporter permease [Burkholderiaceae bacterium]|nr:ABC transporter permease [Burkholderiaceae bacterium]
MDLIFGQFVAGLSYGSTLFLLSAGLTLIFGVTRVVNFAHGSLYMVGAYVASTITAALPPTPLGFFSGLLLAALVVALVGALIEIVVLRRIYSAPEIFQLLATFGLVLVAQDLVLAVWGPEERFAPRAPGLKGSVELFGAFLPEYTLFLIVVGPLVFALLAWLLRRTRWGVWIRASAQDRETAGALGINEPVLFTSVFALGAFLAGLAGALQIPRETVNLQMDMAILVEAFVVVVVGGLGSVTGALWASLAIGLLHAFGTWWLPQSTLVLIFVVMAVVLVMRPHGLLGRPQAEVSGKPLSHPPFAPLPSRAKWLWLAAFAVAAFLPLVAGDYIVVIATEMAIAALLAASLHFAMGLGGIVSFGHAAFFGLGAYAVALAIRHFDAPFALALIGGPIAAAAAALLAGVVVLRSAGVYAAMLTLAFAQILWSTAIQWVDITGGDNGVLGLWSSLPAALAGELGFYWLALGVVGVSLVALRRAAVAPFGFSLRAARDSAIRAEALGIDVARVRWLAFAAGGLFAGLAGALHALQKGAVFPTALSIPVSVDALVMVLLGGLQTLSGPLIGALAYHGLSIELVRATDHWRLVLGLAIVALVVLFPGGIVGFLRHRFEGRSR